MKQSRQQKIKVVHFGNKLKKSRNVSTVLETLEPLFAQFVDIRTCSDKTSKFLKAIDFLKNFFINGLRSDILIIDVFSTLNFYFALFISLLSVVFRKKYILFLHGGNLPHRFVQSQRLFHFMLRHAHRIIAPSDYLKIFFQDKGYKVTLIPNFIRLEEYTFSQRIIDVPRILYIRGFSDLYNPQMLIHAMALIKEKYPTSQAYMIGKDIDGTLEKCKGLAEDMGLTEQITFFPTLSREEWIRLSNKCNMMISVPTVDNTPVSILEGMALGLPVISTNVGGVPYLIEQHKTGILIQSNHINELVDSIAYLAEHPEFVSTITESARNQLARFDWQNIKKDWEEILTS